MNTTIRPSVETKVAEAEGDETDQERTEGIEIHPSELEDWRTGTVVEPTAEEAAWAEENLCGYGELMEGEVEFYLLVDWNDAEAGESPREWSDIDQVVPYRVVPD